MISGDFPSAAAAKVAPLSIAVIALAIGGIAWVLPSYFEAEAYTRITGRHVSTWDAMWVELRVDGR